MKNKEIADIFRSIAGILEIKGENVFRIRAYERAAMNIESLTEDIETLARQDKLRAVPGIGGDLAGKIKEYCDTGGMRAYDEMQKSVPAGVLALLKIPSVGPKTAKLLFEKSGIRSVADLEEAIRRGALDGLAGIKEKTIENMRKGIQIVKRGRERMTLAEASSVADEFLDALRKNPRIGKVEAAGSFRRRKETVRDIDILVVSEQPKGIMDAFVRLPAVKDILAHGETKSSVRTGNGVQVDCRVVGKKSFGAALLYFTGSKNFNIKIRQMAQAQGMKINEYGVFRKNAFVAGATEEGIFKLLGLACIPPELREDTGEIELARRDKLPVLIERADIKGDLHAHSSWSDGTHSIREMAEAAQALGYEYLAMTDHSPSLKVAGGLMPEELKKKKREIDGLNGRFKKFRVLFGTEADIDTDGGIDYPDAILREFDVVVAAIHSGFRQSKSQLTKRIIAACKNKYVHIIAHPTGRLWGTRDAYELDFDEIFNAARDTNTHFEINSFPQRLDLNDLAARRAKETGVYLVISTDAHATTQLDAVRFGVATARRGWLTRDDVINTRTLDDLLKMLRK